MVLLWGRQTRVAEPITPTPGAPAATLIPGRSVRPVAGVPSVTVDSAMRHSAVWACLRLRANLISTMPVDVYRKAAGIQIEVAKPPILVDPGGARVGIEEWLYSTEVDLGRAGNTFGLITERNAQGLPARIDLQPITECSVRVVGDQLEYRLGRKVYPEQQVWHERQYTVPGLPVGLSPVAYAAWTLGEHQSIHEFALSWFGGGGTPRAHLRNTMQTMSPEVASAVKDKFVSSTRAGEPFVTGADWEFKPLQAEQTGQEWMDARRHSVGDVARFFDTPGDLIDAAVATGSITYANIGQRNLQYLIMHLGPGIVRRERALSKLLPRPRFVKLNTSALLRMDDETRARIIEARIRARTLTVSEARALDNLAPLTPEQEAEFVRLFGAPGRPAALPAADRSHALALPTGRGAAPDLIPARPQPAELPTGGWS